MSAEHMAGPHHDSEPARFSPTVDSEAYSERVLRRPISLGVGGGVTILLTLVFIFGIVIRFVLLDAYVLSEHEANWAYDAWSIFKGRPLPGTAQVPDTSPFFLIVQSISFFLFGVTDAIARLGPVLFGSGILILVLMLRPFVSRHMLAGMLILTAISPTLVYASRTVSPEIAVAFSSLLLVVALLRVGNRAATSKGVWIVLAGFGAAATLASGPEGVTSLIAVSSGLIAASLMDSRDESAVRASFRAIGRSASNLGLLAGSFIMSLLVLFTRLFSDISALGGILSTFAEWGRMMASQSTPLAPSFFLYAALLYEILAVVFTIFVTLSGPKPIEAGHRRLSPSLFIVWFAVALLLHSFASGREAEQAVLVALPLILAGGMGLGRVLERVNWSRFWASRTGLLPLALLGLFVGAIAIVMVIARSNDVGRHDATGWSPWFQVIFVIIVVALPMAYLIWTHVQDRLGMRELGNSALLVIALLLTLFTIRSTTALAYYRGDDGTELLARNIPTQGVRALVNQTYRLSRDLSVDNLSNIDNTGSYGLRVAISPDVEWPFAWYFRDFPNLRVVGPAGWSDKDDIVIALTPEGMDSAGFVVHQRAFENRTANAHIDLDASTVFGNVFSPDKWYSSFRYLLFREMSSAQAPSNVSVGYAFRVSNKINPNLGPFNLFMRNNPGPGSGLGQLSSPTAIAVSSDGQIIYVLNAGNQRIERYSRDGIFIGAWDATNDPGMNLAFENGQGASGMTLGSDGLIYIADTWNHIVIVLDQEGKVVRQLGQRGALTDIGDGADPTTQPGLFFGPRGVAVFNDEIYVTDTGNERVQVFGKDGTFKRAFGGFGTGTGQLQEPTGIVAGPDYNLYVGDSGNARVVVFSPQGDVVREIPVDGWVGQLGVDRVNYLAFDASGILYMTAPSKGLLQAWDGSQIVTIENAGVTRPVGIAAAPDGMLLITDGSESNVVHISPKFPPGFGPWATPSDNPGGSPEASPAS